MNEKTKEVIIRSVMSLMVTTEVERAVYEKLKAKYEPPVKQAA